MTGGKGEPGKTGQPVSMRSSFFSFQKNIEKLELNESVFLSVQFFLIINPLSIILTKWSKTLK